MKLSTELLVATYEAAGANERKLVRDLHRKGKTAEVERVLEILHFFPSAKLVKRQDG